MNAMTQTKVRCRQIGESDVEALVLLLARQFTGRPAAYWSRALERLAARPVIADYPRFGYMLECAGAPVGVVLMIFSRVKTGPDFYVRCSLSSWCVDPSYTGYGSLLVALATKFKAVTYLNFCPLEHTRRTIGALGFSRYNHGLYAAVPALSLTSERASVRPFDVAAEYRGLLSRDEIELLADHAAFGCTALVCESISSAHPFVFVSRRIKKAGITIRSAHLMYCRDVKDFQRFAGSIGRALAARGMLLVLVETDAPISGVPGRHYPEHNPLYLRGPCTPRVGDLAYTEVTLFEPGYC